MAKPLFREMDRPLPPMGRWPAEVLYRYQERASICEHESQATREEAEALALAEVTEMWIEGENWK